VARLSALVKDARAAYGENVVFVDGGDTLYEKPTDNAAVDACQAEARTTLLASSLAAAGLAATIRGPLDDVRGKDARDALLQKHGIKSVDDGAAIDVVRDIDKVGVRVVVVGVNDDADYGKAGSAVAAARAESDASGVPVVVVLLVQGDAAAARAAARAINAVDVVVVGKAQEAPSPAIVEDGAVIIQPGWQAQHVAAIDVVVKGRAGQAPLALDDRQALAEARIKLLDTRIAEIDKLLAASPDGQTKDFQAQRRTRFFDERAALLTTSYAPLSTPHIAVRSIPLRRGMAEDAAAAAGLAAYEAAIPDLVTRCESTAVCPESAPGERRYMGVRTCVACHAAAVNFWKTALVDVKGTDKNGVENIHPSGHAIAWDTLVHVGRDKDRSCVGCHSAGFDVAGGACTTTDIVKRGLEGVQCESCHGAGSAHVAGGGDKALIQRGVPEATCRGCHLPPHIQTTASFVYNERLLKVLGVGHGEAAAKAIKAQKEIAP
jgi:hypothetical protein